MATIQERVRALIERLDDCYDNRAWERVLTAELEEHARHLKDELLETTTPPADQPPVFTPEWAIWNERAELRRVRTLLLDAKLPIASEGATVSSVVEHLVGDVRGALARAEKAEREREKAVERVRDLADARDTYREAWRNRVHEHRRARARIRDLKAALREAKTTLVCVAHDIHRELAHRGVDRWEGVPEVLEERIGKLRDILSPAPGGEHPALTDHDTTGDAIVPHRHADGTVHEPPAAAAPTGGERMVVPPLDDDLRAILGRPNFACIEIASALRAGGVEIARKAEDEQAAVIHFFLTKYAQHGPEKWAKAAASELREMATPTQKGGGDGR